jgi:hypothetical protein
MRRNRVALKYIVAAYAVMLGLAAWTVASAAQPKEASWTHVSSAPRTELLTPQDLAPAAVYATAMLDNQAAQAFALASLADASRSTPRETGRSSTYSTQSLAPSGDSAIWSCIIAHESGGDPTAVNPSSGDSGLFQFNDGTWAANGGSAYGPKAMDATPAEQWQIAEATQAADGWSPWVGDGCTPLG